MSATLVAAVSVCFLTSACHATPTAAAHANPALPSTAGSPATPDSAAPDTAMPDPTAPDTTAPDATATATAGAAVAGGCLISPQEAAAAFGHDAGAGRGDAATCTYQTAGGILTVFASSYGDNASTAYNSQRQAATGIPGFQDVSGVGDHAFVNLDDPMSLIEFAKGSTVVVIQLGISPAPSVAVLTSLGQAAAGRI